LRSIVDNTRNIRKEIQQLSEESVSRGASNASTSAWKERQKFWLKRILVVDSDADIRSSAHELLGRYGAHVETAHDGDEACRMIRQFHYDVVLTDIRLPDMTGAEIYERIREMHEHLPVILMTGFGYDPTHSIVKARQMGCESVIFKPFRLDQLLVEVEKAVSAPREIETGA
jgi:two-component system, sensor histidine kinase SagS